MSNVLLVNLTLRNNIGSTRGAPRPKQVRQAAPPQGIQGQVLGHLPTVSSLHRRKWELDHPALKEPLVPRGDGYRSADTGGWYLSLGGRISMKPRWWIHERCLPMVDRPPKYPGLVRPKP